MNPILEIIVKLFASSALLTLFYFALFRGKASYRASRLFLLSIPGLSLVFSLVSIEGGGGLFSFSSLVDNERPTVQEFRPETGSAAVLETIGFEAPVIETVSATAAEEATVYFDRAVKPESGQTSGNTPPHLYRIVAQALYLAVISVFAAILVHQVVVLRRIRRKAERRTVAPGLTVYLSHDVRSAFSVMRTIYINAGVSKEKLAIIIDHERQHIARRHYVDLVIMEFFTVLGWFNPFLWIVRRELRSVHEFEADRGTLAGGVGMRDYMLAILEETAGAIPVMAHGMQSSMIKKRFLKMKTGNKIRLKTLRTALTVPFATALMLFFSLRPATAEPGITTEPGLITPDTSRAQRHDLVLGEGKEAQAHDLVLREATPGIIFAAPADTVTTYMIAVKRRGGDSYVSREIATIPDFMTVADSLRDRFGLVVDLDSLRLSIAGARYDLDSLRNAFPHSKFILPFGSIDSIRRAVSSPEFKTVFDSMHRAVSSPEFKDAFLYTMQNTVSTLNNIAELTPGIGIGEKRAVAKRSGQLMVADFPAGFDFAYHRLVVMPDGRVLSNDDGVEINGVRWALTNVGEPGTFVSRPEDYGIYYKHNEVKCPEGWRLPTIREINSLAASGSRWTTVNGVAGREYGSGGNTVFLPAAGRATIKWEKPHKWVIRYITTHGFYWTSTRAGAGGAHDLLFNEGFSGNPVESRLGDSIPAGSPTDEIAEGGGVIQRRNGLSVRCVKQ